VGSGEGACGFAVLGGYYRLLVSGISLKEEEKSRYGISQLSNPKLFAKLRAGSGVTGMVIT
jgi:hypothetical protein